MFYKTKKEVEDILKRAAEKGWLNETLTAGEYYPAGRYDLSHGEYSSPCLKAVFYPGRGWAVRRESFYQRGYTPPYPKKGPIALFITTDPDGNEWLDWDYL